MAKRRRITSEERYKGEKLPYKDYKAMIELIWWIEDDIFKFKDNEGFNRKDGKYLSLRIQGLITGQFTKNNSREKDRNEYTIEEIVNTFKFVSFDVKRAFETKNFVDVNHQINYMMKAVESNIEEMKRRMDVVKAKREVEN